MQIRLNNLSLALACVVLPGCGLPQRAGTLMHSFGEAIGFVDPAPKVSIGMAEQPDEFLQRTATIHVALGGGAVQEPFLGDVAQQKLEAAFTDVAVTIVGLQVAPDLAAAVESERNFLSPEESAAALELLKSELLVLLKVTEYKRGREPRQGAAPAETLFINATVRAFDLRTGKLILTGDVILEGQVDGDSHARKVAHKALKALADGVAAKLRPSAEKA